MCHFITAVLPKEARLAGLDELALEHGRQFQPQANPSVEEKLRPSEQYFLTTKSHCDCGTALGEQNRDPRKSTDHHAEVKRLRAKGWSEAKVSRWLEQKQQTDSRNARKREDADTSGLEEWLRFLKRISDSGLTPYVGILLHWYNGPLSGRIELRGREKVRISGLTKEMLAQIKEDVLYEFSP